MAEHRIAIYGTSGLGREFYQVIRNINARRPSIDVVGWLDDDPAMAGRQLKGLPVLGSVESTWSSMGPFQVVIGVGSPAIRRQIALRLDALGVSSPILVDPNAWLGGEVLVGEGSVFRSGSMATTDASVGRHVLVGMGSSISHDVRVGDYVTVAPSVSIAGDVRIGEGVDVGIKAAIIQGVEVGDWAIIGAGAVITRDVPRDTTVVGVPAKVIKERPSGWHLGG